MTTVSTLGTYGDPSGSSLMFRNKIINGGFDIWQRGTSQTSSGYGSDDRWSNSNSGTTKTHSRQAFDVGQTAVPGNPTYYSRTVVSSVAGAGNYAVKLQNVENVATLSGQTATLSFWAKADTAKNVAIEFRQEFGSGGSPSSPTSFSVSTVSLTTSWQRYSVMVNVPSISGKILGTNNDHSLAIWFWFDAGSNWNARTNSLGQQSGTFDIAQVQLEAGSSATPFEQRPVGMELALCQRYLCSFGGNSTYETPAVGQAAGGTTAYFALSFPVEMRTSPGLSVSSISHWTACNTTGANITATNITLGTTSTGTRCGVFYVTVASGLVAGSASLLQANNTTSARLYFSAEL